MAHQTRWAVHIGEQIGGLTMIAILGSFLQYVIIMVILAAVGVGGAFAGKKLRERKDAQTAAQAAEDKQ